MVEKAKAPTIPCNSRLPFLHVHLRLLPLVFYYPPSLPSWKIVVQKFSLSNKIKAHVFCFLINSYHFSMSVFQETWSCSVRSSNTWLWKWTYFDHIWLLSFHESISLFVLFGYVLRDWFMQDMKSVNPVSLHLCLSFYV